MGLRSFGVAEMLIVAGLMILQMNWALSQLLISQLHLTQIWACSGSVECGNYISFYYK